MGRVTGNPPGRPRILWTEQEYAYFEKLCSYQCTQIEVTSFFRIDDETLDRLLKERYGQGFSKIYEVFAASGKVQIRRKLFMLAEANHYEAIKWLSKQHLGMAEKMESKVDQKSEITINIGWEDDIQSEHAQTDAPADAVRPEPEAV